MVPREIVIPEGTILYRTAPNICTYARDICRQKQVCSDTGKHGIYFSTYILQALGMVIEYQKDMELGVFRTEKPITVLYGKYTQYRTGSEMHSHLNSGVYPILEINGESLDAYDSWLGEGEGELFLTEDADLSGIQLLETYKINYAALKRALPILVKSFEQLPLRDFTFYKTYASLAIKPIVKSCTISGGFSSARRRATRRADRPRNTRSKRYRHRK